MAEIEENPETQAETESENDSEKRLSRAEAAQRIGISVSKLRTLETLGRIPRPSVVNGSRVPTFPVEVIEAHIAEQGVATPEAGMAELVRTANALLTQEQTHGQRMFDRYINTEEKLFKTLTEVLEKQQDHIMKLEKQAYDMREAADRVLNLEHDRKMEEMKESRREAMQKIAITQVMGFLGPVLKKKFNIDLPAPPPIQSEEENQATMLGQAVAGMVAGMSDEKFAALAPIVGDEAFGILTYVRTQAKGTPS